VSDAGFDHANVPALTTPDVIRRNHENATADQPYQPCDLGYIEYDGAQYCFAHFGFTVAGAPSRRCDRAPTPRPATTAAKGNADV